MWILELIGINPNSDATSRVTLASYFNSGSQFTHPQNWDTSYTERDAKKLGGPEYTEHRM